MARKKIEFFPDFFHVPAKSMRISPRFFSYRAYRSKSETSLRIQFQPDQRISVGFCLLWNMFELKMETFEKLEKFKIFDIWGLRYAAEAIIAHQNWCAIFAIWSIFGVHIAENCFFLASFEKANFQLNHTSI